MTAEGEIKLDLMEIKGVGLLFRSPCISSILLQLK
jgi:hypothetical protein